MKEIVLSIRLSLLNFALLVKKNKRNFHGVKSKVVEQALSNYIKNEKLNLNEEIFLAQNGFFFNQKKIYDKRNLSEEEETKEEVKKALELLSKGGKI
jgi:hypothetical protein